jgi:hypothetical protein
MSLTLSNCGTNRADLRIADIKPVEAHMKLDSKKPLGR